MPDPVAGQSSQATAEEQTDFEARVGHADLVVSLAGEEPPAAVRPLDIGEIEAHDDPTLGERVPKQT